MRALVPAAVLVLAACGGGNSSNGDTSGFPNESAAKGPDAQGSGTVAANGIDCGPVTAQQPQGMDMVGVTVGMPADQAFAKIACSNPTLSVEFSTSGGFQVPPPPDGGQMRRTIVARSENEQITATLVGVPGQERVVTISRRVRFSAGQEPALRTFIQQIESKYGSMYQDFGTGSRNIAGAVLRTPDGQPITNRESLSRYAHCRPTSASANISSDCGPTIRFVISPNERNRELVSEVEAIMTDGAAGTRLIEEYTALAGGAQRQRESQEVQNAQGRSPNL
jgi:hypothetical protein